MNTQGLKTIVIGLLFILFNFTINFEQTFILNIIPTFVGYIFLRRGLRSLLSIEENNEFAKADKIAAILLIVTLITFVMDLMGLSALITQEFIFLGLAISLITMLVQLILLHHLTKGIQIINTYASEHNQMLYATFQVIVVTNILSYLLIFIDIVAFIMIIISFIANIVYIITVNKIANIPAHDSI
jgi:hypothetical protein